MIPIELHDEKHVLSELRRGNRKAFEVIYTQYYRELYVHALQKVGSADEAKDIVQDLFSVIWEKKEQLNIEKSLSSYLHSSIRNMILDRISKDNSKTKYLDSLQEYQQISYDLPDALVREKMLAEQIEKALSKLPKRTKEIFELSRKDNYSHKEIAEALNLSEHTVRSYIKEALKDLKFKFNSYFWSFIVIISTFF